MAASTETGLVPSHVARGAQIAESSGDPSGRLSPALRGDAVVPQKAPAVVTRDGTAPANAAREGGRNVTVRTDGDTAAGGSTPLVTESIDTPSGACKLVVASVRERLTEIEGERVVSQLRFALPERDCWRCRDAVHACHRHGLWEFHRLRRARDVSESGGTSRVSERTVTVLPCAPGVPDRDGDPQLNGPNSEGSHPRSPVAEKRGRRAWDRDMRRSPAVWGVVGYHHYS